MDECRTEGKGSLAENVTRVVCVNNTFGEGKEVSHLHTTRITRFVEDGEMRVFTAANAIGHK